MRIIWMCPNRKAMLRPRDDHNLVIALLLDFKNLLHLIDQRRLHRHIIFANSDAGGNCDGVRVVWYHKVGRVGRECAVEQRRNNTGILLRSMAGYAGRRRVGGKKEGVLTTPAGRNVALTSSF